MRSVDKISLTSLAYLSSRFAGSAGPVNSSSLLGRLLTRAAATTVRNMPMMSAAVLRKTVASGARGSIVIDPYYEPILAMAISASMKTGAATHQELSREWPTTASQLAFLITELYHVRSGVIAPASMCRARREIGWLRLHPWLEQGGSRPRRCQGMQSGVGVQLVQRVGCSSWSPTPDLVRGKLTDATGYPLPYPYFAAAQHHACAISVPVRAVNHGQWRGTVNPGRTTDRRP